MRTFSLFAPALTLALAGLLSSAAHAAGPEAEIARLAGERLGRPVRSVQAAPLPGLYEVQAGDQLVYTDQSVNYFLVGRILGSTDRVDHTAARLAAIRQADFKALPLNLAIKTVRGNGRRELVLFEDPNCPYCKRLHKNLQSLNDVTIHTFVTTLIAPDSVRKAAAIWCAGKPSQALDAWMERGQAPTPAAATCSFPDADIAALSRRLDINGVPTMLLKDGTRLVGVVELAELEAKLH
jgi:thiol:disulfide interchange protein DsbC